jgi:hypothetical protein
VILERICREEALSSEGSTLRGIAVHHMKAAMTFVAPSHAMPSRCKPHRFRVVSQFEIRIILTAAPITSAGRFSPLGPVGIIISWNPKMYLAAFTVQDSDSHCSWLMNSGEKVSSMLPSSVIVGRIISDAINNIGTA